MPYTKSPLELADTFAVMTYGDLMEVASDLATMASDKEVRPTLTEAGDFATLLFDWAQWKRDDARDKAAAEEK